MTAIKSLEFDVTEYPGTAIEGTFKTKALGVEEKHQGNFHEKNMCFHYSSHPGYILPSSNKKAFSLFQRFWDCVSPLTHTQCSEMKCVTGGYESIIIAQQLQRRAVFTFIPCCSTSGPALWELNKTSLERKGGKQGDTSEVFCGKPQPKTQLLR